MNLFLLKSFQNFPRRLEVKGKGLVRLVVSLGGSLTDASIDIPATAG